MNRYLFLFTALCALSLRAFAGDLVVGDVSFNGDTVTVPVSLESSSDGISALDFRLQYDANVFESVDVSAGSAAGNSGKQVMGNTIAPGDFKVLMFGINQETLSSGEVATITLRVKDAPANGATSLQLADVTLSLPNATDIPSNGGTFPVRFPGNETPPEDTEGESEPETPAEEPAEAPTETPATPGETPAGPVGGGQQPSSPGAPAASTPQAGNEAADTSNADGALANLSEEARRRAEALRARLPQGGAAAPQESMPEGLSNTPETDSPTAPPMAETTPPSASPVDVTDLEAPAELSAESASAPEKPSHLPRFGTELRGKILGIGAGVAILAGLIGLRKWLFP